MKKILLIALIFLPFLAQSQSDSTVAASKWQFKGYLKSLQTLTFTEGVNSLLTNTLIHNRLNLKYFPNDNFTAAIEIRNRLFYGEQVRWTPNFGNQIDYEKGLIDLSTLLINKQTMVAHSIIDRLWVDWKKGDWNIRLGRQRINWGINTTWNPNDIFNAYNFLDFDYEERPGTDAVKVSYKTGELSRLELAIEPKEKLNASIAALKYDFNVKSYDIQMLSGIYKHDVVIGVGWAGSIGEIGWKGEAAYFIPYEKQNEADTKHPISISTGFDYTMKGGWYVSGSVLFNSNGGNSFDLQQVATTNLSAKNLMPTKWNIMAQVSKGLTPLTRCGFTTVYSPNGQLLIFIPNLTYSIANNWDIDLIGQVFFAEDNQKVFSDLGELVYVRLKWSF